jgi:hypothetical protein
MPDWKVNPYLSKPALRSFTAQTPYGSNLAGPTRASVWMPENIPASQPHAEPEPDASLMDFLNGLAATMAPTAEGSRLTIVQEAGRFVNLPPGHIDVPRGWSQQDIAELLRQMGLHHWDPPAATR